MEFKNEVLENDLRQLLSYTDEGHKFSTQESLFIIEALDNCKIS